MRGSWHALNTSLLRSTSTLGFHRQFTTLRSRQSELRVLPDPAALLDWLHAPAGDAAARNGVLRALVRAAQADAPEAADTLLLLAVWPGLDAVHRRLARFFRGDPTTLSSELTARVTLNIRTLDLTRVTWVAATLLRNAERDLRREMQATAAQAARLTPAPVEDCGATGPASPFGLPEQVDADTGLALLAERIRPWVREDADLVVAVAVAGERQHEVAARLGMPAETAKKRYQRALSRLRQEFEKAA